MKIIRALIVSIVLVLLAVPGDAVTFEEVENNILKKCEDETANSWGSTNEFYHCALLQLITFKKVIGHYREHSVVISSIINKYWDMEYNTSDWPQVLDDLEDYLKEKEKENERNNLSYRTDFGR